MALVQLRVCAQEGNSETTMRALALLSLHCRAGRARAPRYTSIPAQTHGGRSAPPPGPLLPLRSALVHARWYELALIKHSNAACSGKLAGADRPSTRPGLACCCPDTGLHATGRCKPPPVPDYPLYTLQIVLEATSPRARTPPSWLPSPAGPGPPADREPLARHGRR